MAHRMEQSEISIDEFARIDLRVGTIREVTPHPNADRLLVLSVDIGEDAPRQLRT
jgi:methionyl-tRNA synthetase